MESNKFSIIKADSQLAKEMCAVIIRSIKMLCISDHRNDPEKLSGWLDNKTPENIKKWVEDVSNYSLIALNMQEEIIGISMISKTGEILLNYLLPEYVGKGIGKHMLHEMEKFINQSHHKQITVMSTRTAFEFYKKNGFKENKSNQNDFSEGIPMVKILKD